MHNFDFFNLVVVKLSEKRPQESVREINFTPLSNFSLKIFKSKLQTQSL